MFRNQLGQDIFNGKYRNAAGKCGTWADMAGTLTKELIGCSSRIDKSKFEPVTRSIIEGKFCPAGRYIYYAGREKKFIKNCYAFRGKDSREGWAELTYKHMLSLMSGGGCGTLYSDIRAAGELIKKTGGFASGPISLMHGINELGRNVKQGGSRRSALWAGLHWWHKDIGQFINSKVYTEEQKLAKMHDFDTPLPLDMTNISVVFDPKWFDYIMWPEHTPEYQDAYRILLRTVERAVIDGEPGLLFSYLVAHELANACTEFRSSWDSDSCNLGSVNMSRISSLDEFAEIVKQGSEFLTLGSLRADLPTQDFSSVVREHRAIGLGLTGVHEWLIRRGYGYEVVPELHQWLQVYRDVSKEAALKMAHYLQISEPERFRCIAPAGTISMMLGTSAGIGPIYSKAMLRRYLNGDKWVEKVLVDPTIEHLFKDGIDVDGVETSAEVLKHNPEQCIKFIADVQQYVDMGISTTVHLPANNSPAYARKLSKTILKYVKNLTGLTFYPDGSRYGQPIEAIPFKPEHVIKGLAQCTEEDADILASKLCKEGSCSL